VGTEKRKGRSVDRWMEKMKNTVAINNGIFLTERKGGGSEGGSVGGPERKVIYMEHVKGRKLIIQEKDWPFAHDTRGDTEEGKKGEQEKKRNQKLGRKKKNFWEGRGGLGNHL